MFSIRFSEDPKKRRAERIFLYTVGGAILFIVLAILIGLLIQFLWNATMAAVFSLPPLSFWQAIGLFVLAKLFFGFGMGGGSGSRQQRRPQRKKRTGHAEEASTDVTELTEDETFKKYWQEEGRAAYEAFRRARADESKGEPDDG